MSWGFEGAAILRWCFEDERIRLRGETLTYQSWNCASASPSFGCMVTYRMPGVDLEAMVMMEMYCDY